MSTRNDEARMSNVEGNPNAQMTNAVVLHFGHSSFDIISSFDIRISSFDSSISFQEEIHAIEIDYGMTDVQRVHPQNASDSRAALPQGEAR